jgi:hypothetical protein
MVALDVGPSRPLPTYRPDSVGIAAAAAHNQRAARYPDKSVARSRNLIKAAGHAAANMEPRIIVGLVSD